MFNKSKKLIGECTRGTRGLLASRKGALCLLTLAAMTFLGYLGKLDGIAFSAGCTMISTVFMWANTKTDTHPTNEPSESFLDKVRNSINK